MRLDDGFLSTDGRALIIGLNLLYLLPGVVGGTETYARELIAALARIDTANSYVLFLNRECRDELLTQSPRFTHVVCPVAASSRGRRYVWEQTRLPGVARYHGVDVLHSLGYVGPVHTTFAHVVTIHDVNFLHPCVRMRKGRRVTLGSVTFAVAHTADRVITMSQFSRSEIVHRLRVPFGRVQVAHLAPRTQLNGLRGTASPDLSSPYVIAFAGPSPHKNIPRLVEAFARASNSFSHMLHIVGSLPQGDTVNGAVARFGLASRVRLRGYLSDEAMLAELAGASALAFPSLYEGFGLPVVDAQCLGVPVVCSDAGSLPEVAGSGAIVFDPRSIEEMAAALCTVLTDGTVRQRLVASGVENVARFSWDNTAAITLRAYRDAWCHRSR